MSNAKDDFPDPEIPVITTNLSFGTSTDLSKDELKQIIDIYNIK